MLKHMDTLLDTFNAYAHDLDEKAVQTRQLVQLLKATGGTASLLGVVGLFGTGFAAIPLALGLAAYGVGVGKEKGTTGRFMPMPWSQESGVTMAKNLLQEKGADDDGPMIIPALTEYDYLSLEDKADYTLFTLMGPIMAPMLASANDIEQERLLTQARRTLIKYHSDLIQDPDLLAPKLFGDLPRARAAFAQNLPDELQNRVEPALLEPEVIEATYVEQTPAKGATTAPSGRHDLVSVLTKQLRSTLVLGAPRGGKGYLVAGALRGLPANVDLWVIDPKNDPNEAYYWQMVKPEQRLSFKVNKCLDTEELTERIMDFFERFLLASSSKERPKLLVVDECSPGLSMAMTSAAYKKMMGKIATIASVGPSMGEFVWCISQATTCTDVGFSKANRASLRIVAVCKRNTGDNDTELSWLESVRDTVGGPLPHPDLKGYLQMVDGEWLAAKPFALAPVDATPAPDAPEFIEDVEAVDDRSALEALLDVPVALSEQEQELDRISEVNGWITSSDVKRLASRSSGLRDLHPEKIRDLFRGLAEKGIGRTRGEGSKKAWTVL
jgi:hypothetical protein